MIVLTDLNGREFFINCDLIETIQEIPETKISLVNGKYFLVRDAVEIVADKMIGYYRKIYGSDKTVRFITEKEQQDMTRTE